MNLFPLLVHKLICSQSITHVVNIFFFSIFDVSGLNLEQGKTVQAFEGGNERLSSRGEIGNDWT